METKARLVPLPGLGLILASVLAVAAAAAGTGASQKIPGPLSVFHASKPGETDCAACHAAPGKTSPAKCLACHTEIASRIAAKTGFHRDKPDDCAICHAEHQGREADIVPLDPENFDHSETGADLRGAHLRARQCGVCHTAANSFPRSAGRSYLLKVPGCRGCHVPPHPGRQKSCLACHTQDNWVVGGLPEKD